MAPFTDDELNFLRIDIQAFALVSHLGLATIDETRRDSCLTWLRDKGYQVEHLNCNDGIKLLLRSLGKLLKWEAELPAKGAGRGLDALRDVFEFEVPSSGGLVLELFRSDVIWREDATWLLGLLEIASEHSLQHLACGRRFFTLQVLPKNSPEARLMVGQTIGRAIIPDFEPDFPHSYIR
jgi:hypothetical protein